MTSALIRPAAKTVSAQTWPAASNVLVTPDSEVMTARTSTSALKVVITAVTTLHAPTPLVDSNVLALADLKAMVSLAVISTNV